MGLNFYQAAEPTTTLVFNAVGIVGGNAPRIGVRDNVLHQARATSSQLGLNRISFLS